MSDFRFVVVTGMSGAGRTTALRALEDLQFFCVDNLPPPLIGPLTRLLDPTQRNWVGLGVDVRTGSFLAGAVEAIDELALLGDTEVIFLEAQDGDLVRRFSETRRAHPLALSGDIPAAIALERERLAELRTRADIIIDTTGMSVHNLRRQLVDTVARGQVRDRMVTRVVSFGFKFGLPVDADLVFDLRFLPNPHFVPELKPLTGLDPAVADFVLGSEEGAELQADLTALLEKLVPRYAREGKAYLTIAVGCTGGQHRSVAMAEALGRALAGTAEVTVEHRDRPTGQG